MPHTNRKKKGASAAKPGPKIVHSKRQEIEDSDGWTHVVNARPRSNTHQHEKVDGVQSHVGDFEKSGFSYVTRTLGETEHDLWYFTKMWQDDSASIKLGTVLPSADIKNIVCLGLGSLQNARREGRRDTWYQLCALRSILELYEGKDKKLEVILQDPVFSDLDKQFLTSLGYTVVDDPAAFQHVTGDSLVYAIHCYNDVFKQIVKFAKPAMMIRNKLDDLDLNPTLKDDAAALQELIQEYEGQDFPQLQNYHSFSDTKIYWRKDLANTQAGSEIPSLSASDHERILEIKSEEVVDTKPAETQAMSGSTIQAESRQPQAEEVTQKQD
ncbi:hypothetical protein B0O99DRAFT_189157 [Bisporella sp. PMI_857]|nr:hypothetical protein B0O99DRAFT_189157 [Bisporella sp. PMI_857]